MLLHQLAGWGKNVPQSMSNYVRGVRTFRRSSNPPAETRLWMTEGIAAGISPWYHHVGAIQEDKRQFSITAPLFQWHKQNEEFFYNRQLLANVGLVWSHANSDFQRNGIPS